MSHLSKLKSWQSASFAAMLVALTAMSAGAQVPGKDGERTLEVTAKGYWVGTSDLTDIAGIKRYRAANREVLSRYGAKFIIRHGRQRIVEGRSRSIQTIVEFPSYAAAVAAYDDPAYRAALKFRHAASTGDMVIVEGYTGPQGF